MNTNKHEFQFIPTAFIALFAATILFITAGMGWAQAPENEKPFDEAKWQELVIQHKKSPCIQEKTVKCLLGQVVDMKLSSRAKLSVGKAAPYSESDKNFVEAVINHGGPETARKIVDLLPADAEEERMSLLFWAGDYDGAIKILDKLNETRKNGTDYGAIWVLTQKGDLDKALELAREVVNWQYVDPNPPPAGQVRVVRSGFCEGNITSSYPRSIGVLANRLAAKKEYDKTFELVKLLKQYIHNKLNGRGYFNCYWKDAKWAYEDAAFGLAAALSKDGQKDRAKTLYSEIQASAKEMDTNALLIAREMRNSGFAAEVAAAIAVPAEKVVLRDPVAEGMFYDQQVRQDFDPVSIALGTAGEYAQAIQRLESLPYPNIRINTFFDLARAAVRDSKIDNAKEILDHLSPFLGKRNRPIDNVLDYADFSDLRFETGDKEGSKAALQTSLKLYEPLQSAKMYERLEFGGNVMVLLAKLGEYAVMHEFMKDNAIDYNSSAGSTFTRILTFFAKMERWDDFDKFLAEQGPAFKQKGGGEFNDRFYIREMLGGALIPKKQFERYLKVSQSMEDPQFQYNKFRSLVIEGFRMDSGIPDTLFSDMWGRTIEGCKSRKELTPDDKMTGCYMGLIGSVQDRVIFSGTKGDVYMSSGY